MKKFDLSIISDTLLTSFLDDYREKEELTQYVLSLNKIEAYKFILASIDLYNLLESNSELKEHISNFLKQTVLNPFRGNIMLWANDNFIPRKDFLELEIASERLFIDRGSGLVNLLELEKLENEYFIRKNRKLKLQAILNKNI